ncbi:MAG: hypothetical protein ACREAX_01940, partial [Candidatus Nitrosotenuis sp.]
CNIDTGISASIIAQMIKNGIIKENGSFSPEAVVPPKIFFEELAKKKMFVYEDGRIINKPQVVVHRVYRSHSKKQITMPNKQIF